MRMPAGSDVAVRIGVINIVVYKRNTTANLLRPYSVYILAIAYYCGISILFLSDAMRFFTRALIWSLRLPVVTMCMPMQANPA